MKGLLVTLPVRRVAAVLALGAALVTTGCGPTEAGRAATVDGRVITEEQVQTAQSQINTNFPSANLTTSQVLGRLITAPTYLELLQKAGTPVSESVARNAYESQPDFDGEAPAEATLEVLRAELAYQQLVQSGAQVPVETFTDLRVEVNPRYGTFDPQAVADPQTSGLSSSLPPWVEAYSADQ